MEAYDAEINEIAPDDLGEEVELNEEDDDYSDEDTETEGKNKSTKRSKGRNPLFLLIFLEI